MEQRRNDTEKGKLMFSEINLIHVSSTKANPTWTGLELNSGLLDEKSEQKYEFSFITIRYLSDAEGCRHRQRAVGTDRGL